MNDVQMYADRDLERVRAQLERAVAAFIHSAELATYMLTACEIDGRMGLYGSDFFNRSAYRRKLERLGMRFSDDAFVLLREDGRFESRDFGAFTAEFVSLGTSSGGTAALERMSGAIVVHQLAFHRIADIVDPSEVARLARAAERLGAIAAERPEDLVRALAR